MLTKSQRRSLSGEIRNIDSILLGHTMYVSARPAAIQFMYRKGLIAGRNVFAAKITAKFFMSIHPT